MPDKRTGFAPQATRATWFSTIGLSLGAAIGIDLADIDLRIPDWLLSHRALLTHGGVVPVLVAGWYWISRHQMVRGLAIGFAIANAAHLSFDLFPHAWQGDALIYVFTWGLPPAISWGWIATGIVCCLYLARCLIRTIWNIVLSLGATLAGFAAYAHEGLLHPLVAFSFAGILAFLLPTRYRTAK